MGLFDLFSKKDGSGALKKHAERVANKRAQAPDRWESIVYLAKLGTPEAVEALLPRFGFYTDPSITDQEEKQAAFDAIVAVGDAAVPMVQAYLTRAESLSWGLKLLDRLLPADDVRQTLLDVLKDMDTEYERDPQRKIQVLSELEARKGPGVLQAVLPFVEDVNETARFHAVGAVLCQDDSASAREALTEVLAREESMRIKARLLDDFAGREWAVDAGAIGPLPEGFRILASGVPARA